MGVKLYEISFFLSFGTCCKYIHLDPSENKVHFGVIFVLEGKRERERDGRKKETCESIAGLLDLTPSNVFFSFVSFWSSDHCFCMLTLNMCSGILSTKLVSNIVSAATSLMHKKVTGGVSI